MLQVDICIIIIKNSTKYLIMKKTKLSLVAASIALMSSISIAAVAQQKPVTLGVKAGANLSTFGGSVKDAKSTMRYRVGLTTDFALTHNLFIFTGLDFQTKGAKYASKSSTDIKSNPVYVQIPVSIGYKYDVSSSTKLVLNAGAYAAYGVAGKIKTGPDKAKESIFSKDGFKRFDYGLLGGIGLEVGKIAINAGYEYGLANINHASVPKITNRNPYLTVGYKF